jgi:IS30 family transposase
MIELIELTLVEKWSPEQISGCLLGECSPLISDETIYRHICDDKRSGGVLYTLLRRQDKKH